MQNHVSECTQVPLAQQALHRRKHKRNLSTSAQSFLVRQFAGLLRFADTRNREMAGFDLPHILCVVLGPYQLVVATADEIEQVVKKLGYVGGTHKVIQPQFADVAAEKNPQLLFVQHSEGLVRTL